MHICGSFHCLKLNFFFNDQDFGQQSMSVAQRNKLNQALTTHAILNKICLLMVLVFSWDLLSILCQYNQISLTDGNIGKQIKFMSLLERSHDAMVAIHFKIISFLISVNSNQSD